MMASGYSNQYSRRLRVFLCHSSGDKPPVRKLFHRLVADGFDPWLDEENLIAGQQWQREIPKAVRSSDVVVVCLSRSSITKTGYIQKEIKFALDVADEQPEGTIFLIPLKLEECDIPERLSPLQWIDYFEERGHERLIKALKHRANSSDIHIENAPIISGNVLIKDQERSVASSKEDAIQDESVTKQATSNFTIKPKLIIAAFIGVLVLLIAGTLIQQRLRQSDNTNHPNLSRDNAVSASPSPPIDASNRADINQNSQPAPSPSPTLNTVTVRMMFSRYGGSGGEMPFKREAVTVNAGGQRFTERTSSKGMVSFSNMPCGNTITVSVISDYLGENKRHSKTLRLNCSDGVVDLGKFYVYGPTGDGRLYNDAFNPP